MDKILRPTWAEVDLSAVQHNLKYIKSLLSAKTKLLFVLKANAYGHGARALAQAAQDGGWCDMLGTASIEEGLELRAAGVTMPILVLGSIYPFEAFEVAIKNNLAITIASAGAALALCSMSEKLKIKACCHIKQDTGMGRIGSRREGVAKILEILNDKEYVAVGGLYTHLACPNSDEVFTSQQLGFFESAALEAKTKKRKIELLHTCATYGALFAPRGRFDMVRIGIGAYGMVPEDKNLIPALSLKSRIVFIKDVEKGFSVSYNRSFIATRKTRVATIPVGYGDGYLRALSNKAEVLVNGKRCKVLGNITMDMTMIDITDVPGTITGDEVVLIGRQKDAEITAIEVARHAGTIPYEVTTLITARVPRIYK